MNRAASVRRRAAFALVVSTCAAATGQERQEPGYRADVLPLLEARCASCHMTEDAAGGLVLERDFAWAMTVGVPSTQAPLPRITPGAPERSYLFLKVTTGYREAGGTGWRMPIGFVPLSAVEIELLRRWIERGAPDD